MDPEKPRPLPGAVLFACNLNRVRSPMAEALLKRQVGDRIYVDSCGLEGDRSDEPDPLAAAVMAEVGCELAGHRSKAFEALEDDSFDLVITLTPEAHQRAVELARGRSVEVEYWPTPDPTLTEGSRETRLAAYREVRDGLARRIAGRFGAARAARR
ncbi:MAG: low molecular weight phosphatase family protein [Phenylobacterium sp.]